MKTESQIKIFKLFSTLEAISFLLLLLVAMPLKYIWDMPEMVSVVGMVHGILFVLYVFGAYWMYEKLNWPLKKFLIALFCAVLPFGPFYVERNYLPAVHSEK